MQEKPRKGGSKPPVINAPRPNLKELAASLGISVSTVSRVLSGRAEQNRSTPATPYHANDDFARGGEGVGFSTSRLKTAIGNPRVRSLRAMPEPIGPRPGNAMRGCYRYFGLWLMIVGVPIGQLFHGRHKAEVLHVALGG